MIWIVHIHDGAARQLKAIPPDLSPAGRKIIAHGVSRVELQARIRAPERGERERPQAGRSQT
jgi:hypothetical protein